MSEATPPRKRKSLFKWILWVLLVQVLLVNISSMFYGYRLTYFYEPGEEARASTNVFTKTWSLFTGPRVKKVQNEEAPHFSYETIRLMTKDSLALESWYVPVDSSKGTVILVHGLGANKSTMLSEAYEFMYLGFTVMLIDLRGHGNSDGHVTTLGYSEGEDVKLAYDYVSKKGEKNIILYGFSLGAAAIAKGIHDYGLSPKRVILEIPFDRQEKLFAKRGKLLGFPEEPFGVLVTFWASVERGFNAFRQNTSTYAEAVKCPVLLQYGALDKIVSANETNSVFQHLGSAEKRLVKYDNADHEFLLKRDPEKWRNEVSRFLLP